MSDDDRLSGQEPQLGGAESIELTGDEPRLGGKRTQDWKRINEALDGLRVNRRARLLARRALQGSTRDPGAVPGLLELLSSDRGGYLRMEAARTLGEIGDTGALPGLIDALNDEDANVRTAAVWAIGMVGHSYAVGELSELLLTEQHTGVSTTIIWALKQIGGRYAVTALQLGLQHPWEQVRRDAVLALGHLRDGSAVPVLRDALYDSSEQVRTAATEALTRIHTPEALVVLERWQASQQRRPESD